MQENKKVLAQNTFFLYVMQISGYIFPLLTFPYLTRTLGPENYGIVVFANAIMAYFTLLFEFGFILSATKDCSEYRDDKIILSRITVGVIQAKLFLVLCGFLILIFLCVFVEQFRTEKTFFILSYIGIVLSIFLPDYLFRGIEKMSVLTYRVILSKIMFTLLIFLFIRKSEDYILYPIAVIGSNFIAVVLTWLDIYKHKYIKFTKVGIKETFIFLKNASTFFLSRLAVSLYTTLNTVLLGLNFSNVEVGLYGTANQLTGICRNLLSPISDSIYPYMIKNRDFKLVKKIVIILEPIIICLCVLAYFISPSIIILFCGEAYSGSVPIFRAMLPLIVISLPTYLFGYPTLGALNKTNIANISVIIGAAFHILGLIILYSIGYLTFINISFLTFATEVIVFTIRISSAVKALKNYS